MDVIDISVAKKYTDDTVAGAGALEGKPCQIQSITDITGGHRVTFLWVDNSSVSHTSTMDVMDGEKGDDGLGIKSVAVNSSNHLIVTYDDDTTEDAGEITLDTSDFVQKSSTAGLLKNDGTVDTNTYVQTVSGKGLSTNDYTDNDKTALQTTIPLEISQLQGSMLTKANSADLATVATSGAFSDLSGTPTVDQVYGASSANAQSGVAVASAISGKADSSAIDEWTATATVDSNNQVTFTGLNDAYGYSLYCNNGNLVGITDMEKTGSGTSVQIVFTLSNVSQGDTCKLRVLKG